ncbi:DUF4286 family protein [Sporichthya sp.]|uniref:DUF4286 family protein n=1 Tax=Sporichthya sp. TaxID=65475 RepID=UPI0017A10CD6|nr:DUF4286 family protein [Sporichthya sp.]MBA3745168.1 hypothetical protein [Sporichthya sp.]
MSAQALLVVFSNAVEGADEEFNRWYNTTHSPDIVKLGVAVSFTRYKASGVPLMAGIPEPARYAVIYEITATTVEGVQQAAAILKEGLEAGQTDISPSMDLTSVQAAWLLPITDHVVGEPQEPAKAPL